MSECFKSDGAFSLLRLAPAVLRARGFRLYVSAKRAGSGGARLVDLWQNGGAAALGHTPPLQLRELKNAAARGLHAPLPHFMEDRCIKALARVFPERDLRVYAAPPSGLEALALNGSAELWRPFLDPEAPLAVPEGAAPVLVPVVPGIQGWRVAGKNPRGETVALPLGFCAIAVDTRALAQKESGAGAPLPPGDLLPPALLAMATRGIHDFVAGASARAKVAFPRVAKALRREGALWHRQGAYLAPRQVFSGEEWEALFRKFLDAGFLLPPVPFQPAILPGELSDGEEARLARLLEEAR